MKKCRYCPQEECFSCRGNFTGVAFDRTTVKNQILNTLRKFYENNELDLIRRKCHEVAIAHRIALYLENLYTPYYKNYNFDIEYNRNGEDPKYYNSNAYARPDIIIHKRNCNKHNFLIIEIKTEWNSETTQDLEKLKRFTSAYPINTTQNQVCYNYKFGLSLLIKENLIHMNWFENGISIKEEDIFISSLVYKPWEFYLDKNDFEKIRNNKLLPDILSLSRMINALRFSWSSIINCTSDSSFDKRQRTNSFFISIGVLCEGFKIIDRLYKDYKNNKTFQDGFGKMLSDKKVINYRNTILERVRNKVSFHFLSNVIQNTLSSIDLPKYVFAFGSDEKSINTYYGFADEIAINYIIGKKNNTDEEIKYFYELVNFTSDLALSFIEASESLIYDFLSQNDIKLQPNQS